MKFFKSLFGPKEKHLRAAADIVSAILIELKDLTRPGVSLDYLDELASRRIKEHGAKAYNKNYKPAWAKVPFPATLCASVNEEVAHAAPAGRTLKEGDIVSYDIGIKYKSACGDAGLTVAVGEIDNRKKRLLRYCENALYEAIKVVKAGIPISAIGERIETYCGQNGYQIIRVLGGHHIGKEMHEEPFIPNFYDSKYDNIFLKEGQIICIEPMITPGRGRTGILGTDKWTVFCIDNQPAAMFEHMILVKGDGAEILTSHIQLL